MACQELSFVLVQAWFKPGVSRACRVLTFKRGVSRACCVLSFKVLQRDLAFIGICAILS